MARRPSKPQGRPDPSKVPPQRTVELPEIRVDHRKFCILGRSPFLFHRKSQKAWMTLLMGGGTAKKPSDRKNILKHRPMPEFRGSVYKTRDPHNATLLQFPCSAFRQAAQTAALDVKGVAKAEVGRWIVVEGGPRDDRGYIDPEPQNMVNMYGVPQITLDMVKNLGRNRAPDVRCKAILPQWCCEIYVYWPVPNLQQMSVINLLRNGGRLAGVGDGRQEKGKLSLGLFTVVDETDPLFRRIKREGGRKAQEKAMENPVPHTDETEALLAWYQRELERRIKTGEYDPATDDTEYMFYDEDEEE